MSEPGKGTVISGTLKNEDLIPALTAELKIRDTKHRHREFIKELDFMIGIGQSYFDSDSAVWDLDQIFSALDSMSPAGCYFGAHPGDGSDFGFWDEDILELRR